MERPHDPHTPHPRVSAGSRLGAAALLAVALACRSAPTAAGAARTGRGLAGSTLFVNPVSTTLEAAQSLTGQARDDAQLLGSIPSADWFTKGTPAEVEAAVDAYVDAAPPRGAMPVLVAYNLPFRDCAQYSAGGAADTAAYKAWIDGFAAGIGDRAGDRDPRARRPRDHPALHDPRRARSSGASRPRSTRATAARRRFAQLNYAVDALGALPATSVYLDGTTRLAERRRDHRPSDQGGRERRRRVLPQRVELPVHRRTRPHYGTWISSCIAYVTEVSPGDFG